MKRSELRNFDIVELRDGTTAVVNVDKYAIVSKKTFGLLDEYDESLEHKDYEELDIMKVARPKEYEDLPPIYWKSHLDIWEREKRPELSHEEEIILKALNKPEWWLVRDHYGLYLHDEKPVFEKEWKEWLGGSVMNMILFNHMFAFVGKDEDRYQVKELLRG